MTSYQKSLDGDIPEQRSPALKDLSLTWKTIPRFLLLLPIRLYQKTISPALPSDTCRYYPTCSHYSYQAIYKYGTIKGTRLAVNRVFRCNPFSDGGFDPVP